MDVSKKKILLISSFVLTFLITLLVVYKYTYARKTIYPYDPKVDYSYNEENLHVLPLTLKDKQVVLPDFVDNNYTAFLKLKVTSTFWGKWFQTAIQTTFSNQSSIDYFEDGVHGFRYINISTLLQKGPQRLELNGVRTRIEDQQAHLLLFKNNDLSKAKILVIGTHPDDAEIAAYGLYSKYPDNTFVLNIKSGESGPFKYDEVYKDTVEHYKKKGQLRTWNSITVPLLGGIGHNNTLNLGYFSNLKDMFLESPRALPATFTKSTDINVYRKQNFSKLKDSLTAEATWPSLVDNIGFLLKHLKPDVIVTPYPRLDAHEEHQFTTLAVMQALKQLKIKSGELFLYTNHFILNEYFPYGPSGGAIPLPPNFDKDLYFRSVFSNDLDTNLQKDKLFALEAMHDLRPDTDWRFGWPSLKKSIKKLKGEISKSDNSYFRRAVRKNELFFVVPVQDIYEPEVWKKINALQTKTLSK